MGLRMSQTLLPESDNLRWKKVRAGSAKRAEEDVEGREQSEQRTQGGKEDGLF